MKRGIRKMQYPVPSIQYRASRARGFTLIEMAIILVIIGLLIGLGATLMGPLTKRAKYAETKGILDAAVESVVGFAATNDRIPDTSEFPGVVRRAKDVWGRDLYYIPDSSLITTSDGGVCGRKTTSMTLKRCSDASCTTPVEVIQNVTFIVISGGANFNIQTDIAGTTVKIYNQDIDGIDDYPADMDRPERYDDLVKWVTLDELRIKAGCLGPQLKILNNELPVGYENNPGYSAVIYADGGVPFTSGGSYRWCRQESASTGLTFNPSTLSGNCLSLTEGAWGQADNLAISGTPTTSGSFDITFFVRDNNDPSGGNDNIAQKTLVLTINPEAPTTTTSSTTTSTTTTSITATTTTTTIPQPLTIKNNSGTTVRYKDGSPACRKWNSNSNITISSGSPLDVYEDPGCPPDSLECSKNYSELKAKDENGNNFIQMNPVCNFWDD